MRARTSCMTMPQKITKFLLPRLLKTCQLGSKMVSNRSKAPKTHSNIQKDHFFLAGTLMEEPKDLQNLASRHLPNQSKVLLCHMCLPTSAFHRIRALRRWVLGSKSVHVLNKFHMHVSIPADLIF